MEIIEFLGTVWPWFPVSHARAADIGLRWDECSTPFLHRKDGRIVSHVGVLELPLVIAGREQSVACIHAVATAPDLRGQGLMRGLMEEALAYIDRRYATCILAADQPEIYRRFGFVSVPEYRFTGPAPSSAGIAPPARDLDLNDPNDLSILRRLMRDRVPVSSLLGVVRERDVFLFHVAIRRLRYAEDLDTIIFCDVREDRLCLYDVVATHMPSLADITARIAEPLQIVEVQFSPDSLSVDLNAEPWMLDDEEILMARGPFLPPGAKACLPRTARG